MNRKRTILPLTLGWLLAGCGGATLEQDAADHAEEAVVVEAAAVQSGLDASGASAVFRASGGFARLGVLWDAADPDALELRTSADGARWSAWERPLRSSSEDGAHVGRLDRDATFYQYRVPPGRPAPSFLSLEPLRHAPAAATEESGAAEAPGQLTQGLGTPIGAITIHSRADWGARAPKCSTATSPYRATIHHTVTPTSDSMSAEARLRQIQSYHMDTQGWCDIGYNYLVSRDGRVWRGRGAQVLGAHVEDDNTGNVGISFMGTYTSTKVTDTQLCNGAKLLAELHHDFPAIGLNRTDVKGHRQRGSTACPGDALYGQIDAMLRKAVGGCDKN